MQGWTAVAQEESAAHRRHGAPGRRMAPEHDERRAFALALNGARGPRLRPLPDTHRRLATTRVSQSRDEVTGWSTRTDV